MVQVVNDGARVLRGKDMRRVAIIEADEDGTDGLSVVVDGSVIYLISYACFTV